MMFHGPLPEREGASQAERAAFARVHSGSSNTRPVDLCCDCFCHCLPARMEGEQKRSFHARFGTRSQAGFRASTGLMQR